MRQFSSEVVTLVGHTKYVRAVAAMPDGRVITSSNDMTLKVWRDGACGHTIQAHTSHVTAVAVALSRVDRRHDEWPPELLAVLLASTSGGCSRSGAAVQVRLTCGA